MAGGMKRGVKMKPKSLKDIVIGEEEYPQEDTIVFEYDEFLDYSFPKRDLIPDGWYYALIKEARESYSQKGDKCFDIYYKLLSGIQYAKWCNGYIDEVEYFYMKQRFKCGSEAAKAFEQAMRKIGVPKRFTLKDVVGLMDGIKIEYINDYSIGSIIERKIIPQNTDIFEINDGTEDEDIYEEDDEE